LQPLEGIDFLAAPPISILIDQELVETATRTSDGTNKKTLYIDQSLFSIACAVNDEKLTLFPLNISAKLDTPFAFPHVLSCTLLQFNKVVDWNGQANGDMHRPSLQEDSCTRGDSEMAAMRDIMEEMGRFAELLFDAIDSQTEEGVSNINSS